jgi:glycopeptide antibiotics resistance protein
MRNQASEFQLGEHPDRWSSRILALAIAGILFLTLYPFRFSFHTNLPGNTTPFLLASEGKGSGAFNAFLNILLFVPFGWGLSQKLRARRKSSATTLLAVIAASALFSYGIEFIQIYIPTRDSGWEDIFTNATGGMVGYFVFELLSMTVLTSLSKVEYRLDRHLTQRRALWAIPLYFATWFTVSVPLQEQSRLSNWVPDQQLFVGNDATGHFDRAWKGQVSRLQFWNQALPANLAQKITAGETNAESVLDPLAIYEFSAVSPYQDQRKFLPALNWTPSTPDTSVPRELSLTGSSWLTSESSVPSLVQAFKEANRFSIQVVCAPAEVGGSDGRIVSISQRDGQVDLSLRQRDGNLVFWFRNPLSIRRDQLALTIPEVFVLHEVRDILLSYDGSNLSLYINGKRDPRVYELTPGAPLAQLVRQIKMSELEGYTYIFYALVFMPGGVLLGVAARRIKSWSAKEALVLGIAVLLASVCLEVLLVQVSGRAFAPHNILLSVLLVIGGILWVNADRKRLRVGPIAAKQE